MTRAERAELNSRLDDLICWKSHRQRTLHKWKAEGQHSEVSLQMRADIKRTSKKIAEIKRQLAA